MNPQVDAYLSKANQWPQEMAALRNILLDCGLTEELKWGKPCYAFQQKNIVVIQGFKDYCALLFFKGFLLRDANGILVKTGQNTRVGRQARFTTAREIVALEPVLKAYIYEAIEVERAGLKVPVEAPADPIIPTEFQDRLSAPDGAALKAAFEALTPGRQRAYIYYFSAPKQSKTRSARIEKCIAQILNGKGLTD
jgi:uncharacterized protein YdeI (YjbR/CyaY-like superfamily)